MWSAFFPRAACVVSIVAVPSFRETVHVSVPMSVRSKSSHNVYFPQSQRESPKNGASGAHLLALAPPLPVWPAFEAPPEEEPPEEVPPPEEPESPTELVPPVPEDARVASFEHPVSTKTKINHFMSSGRAYHGAAAVGIAWRASRAMPERPTAGSNVVTVVQRVGNIRADCIRCGHQEDCATQCVELRVRSVQSIRASKVRFGR
jgi:hypothetical protein